MTDEQLNCLMILRRFPSEEIKNLD